MRTLKMKVKKKLQVVVRATEGSVKLTHPNQVVGTIAEFLPKFETRVSAKTGKSYKAQVGEKMIRAYTLSYKKDKLVVTEVTA